jgi:aerobic carbon-monoxide dehydrogenase medium subunit
MIPAPVGYVRVDSVEDAIEALADPEAKILAGGHSLVPMMKLRLAHPTLLVDIGRLQLRGVEAIDDGVSIGTLTTYAELLESPPALVPSALREAAAVVGDLQVRNRGTVGGGIAHADPSSDAPASVIALGARLRLRSAAGVRECSADAFFRGPFTTALAQEEILEAIIIDGPVDGDASAYRSVQDAASGYPLAGAAVWVQREGDRITRCTIGLTGAAPAPARLTAVEQALLSDDERPTAEVVRDAVADVRLVGAGGSDAYVRQLAVVTITRAYEAACARAFGQEAA